MMCDLAMLQEIRGQILDREADTADNQATFFRSLNNGHPKSMGRCKTSGFLDSMRCEEVAPAAVDCAMLECAGQTGLC